MNSKKMFIKSKIIFSILVFAGLMIGSSVSANAQTGGAVELKKHILEQIASGARARAAEPIGKTEAPAAELYAASEQTGTLAAFPKKNALIGTWNVTLIFPDGFQGKSILQIFPGDAEGVGTVLHASEFSLTLPNPTLPEQGVWEYVGTQFIASYQGFAFTEQFEPFGKIGFRHAITLGINQETFTGRALLEVIDANGQVLFSTTCQTRGVRQRAVAP